MFVTQSYSNSFVLLNNTESSLGIVNYLITVTNL